MRKVLAGAVVPAAIATPALATEFFITQNSVTRKCTIVDKRPTLMTTTVVGRDHVYTTREETTTAMNPVTGTQGPVGGRPVLA